MNLLSLAWRNVLRNRRRSLLTLAAISVAACAIVLLGGYLAATVRALETDTVRQVGHLQMMPAGAFEFGRSQPARYALRQVTQLQERIASDPELRRMVAFSAPMLRFQGVAGRFESGASSAFAGVGWEPAAQRRLLEWDGHGLRLPPGASYLREERPEAGVIGAGMAQQLGLCKELEVPDCRQAPDLRPVAQADAPALSPELVHLAKDSAVPALAEQTPGIELLAASAGGAPSVMRLQVLRAQRMGARELDAMHVAMPLGMAQRLLFGPQGEGATALVIQLHRTDDLEAARLRLRQVAAGNAEPLEVLDFHAVQPQFDQVIAMFTALFRFVGLLMLVVTLFSVSNTVNMAVSERTTEIGTLRAIGWMRHRVRALFLLEGGMLGALGSLCGMVLATLLAQFVINTGWLHWTPPGRSTPVPIGVDLLGNPWLLPGVLLVFVGLSCLSSWWPARRASALPVVEALRHG